MFWDRFYSQCLKKEIKPNPLAKELGISSGVITKWKNGGIPNGETLNKIADYLDCSVDYLLGRTDIPKEAQTLDEQLKGVDFALYGETHDLTEEEKQDILEFVQYIKSKRKNKES